MAKILIGYDEKKYGIGKVRSSLEEYRGRRTRNSSKGMKYAEVINEQREAKAKRNYDIKYNNKEIKDKVKSKILKAYTTTNKVRGNSIRAKISQAKIRQLAGNLSGRVPVKPFSNILTGKPEGDSNGKAV